MVVVCGDCCYVVFPECACSRCALTVMYVCVVFDLHCVVVKAVCMHVCVVFDLHCVFFDSHCVVVNAVCVSSVM